MIKITKKQIEQIMLDSLGKRVDYWGREVGTKNFAFFDKDKNEWIFWPQRFFIDIIKNKHE